MKEVLTVLPSLIHLSLLLFAIGLCVFLWDVHYGVAIPVVIVTAIAAGAYFACTIFPIIYQHCPYGTVLSRLYKQFSSEYSQSVRDGGRQDETTSRALHWMIVNCETPRSVDVALQSLAGAERGLPSEMLEKCDAWSLIRHRMETINATGEKVDRAGVLYKRALECHLNTRTFGRQMFHELHGTDQLVSLVLGVQACINSIIYKSQRQPRWLDTNKSILMLCRYIGPQLLGPGCNVFMTSSSVDPMLASSVSFDASNMHTQRSEALAQSLTHLLEKHMNSEIEMEPAQHAALCTCLILLLSRKIADDPSLTVPYILRLIRAYLRQQTDKPKHTHNWTQDQRAANDLNQSTLAFLLGVVAVLNTGCFVKELTCFSDFSNRTVATRSRIRSNRTLITRSRISMEKVVELGWQYLLSIVYPGISSFNASYYLIHGGFDLLMGANMYNLSSEDCTLISNILPNDNDLGFEFFYRESKSGCFARHLQEFTSALAPYPDLDALPFPLLTCRRILPNMVRGLRYLQPTPESYVLIVNILSWDSRTKGVMKFHRLMGLFPFPKASPRLIHLLSVSGVFTQLVNWLESEDLARQAFAIAQIWLFFNMSLQAPDRKSDAMNKLETMLPEYPGLKNELGKQEMVAEDLEFRFLALLSGDEFQSSFRWEIDRNTYLYRILELMLQQRCTPLPEIVNFELQGVAENLRGTNSFIDLDAEAVDQPRGKNVSKNFS
ncbi:hypothetical protein ACGC1H_003981 [Rhizoctonia solani]